MCVIVSFLPSKIPNFHVQMGVPVVFIIGRTRPELYIPNLDPHCALLGSRQEIIRGVCKPDGKKTGFACVAQSNQQPSADWMMSFRIHNSFKSLRNLAA